jgi:hypothetical protein
MKARSKLAVVLFALGALALMVTPDGLGAAQRLLASLVELWQDFVSKDIVGIV